MAEEVLKNLFFIERGYLNANHFVYRSDNPVLIDTGYKSDFPETARLIGMLGVDLSAVGKIICTHSHGDHVGGNRLIQEISGCEIAMHKHGRHFVETGDDWSTWWKYYSKEADFFSCTVSLTDGDTISIGPHQFRVIHTPGHATDGIVLYNRKEKVLISSDTLWEDNLAVMTLRIEGSGALFSMLESIEKIESLDVRTVYPGHGKSFSNFKEGIEKSKSRLKKYMENRERIGTDLLKKMVIFNLLMAREIREEEFFTRLMSTYWYPESVDLYFNGEYRGKYEEVMRHLTDRGIIRSRNGTIYTVVRR